MNSFIISSRELSKLALMSILSTALFGVLGLLILLMMQWMTLQAYASDVLDKHGISEKNASRLGGAALAIGVVVSILYMLVLEAFTDLLVFETLQINWAICLSVVGCFSLGLMEDIKNNSLSPKSRLIGKAMILLVAFILSPALVPSKIGVWGIDWLLSFPWLAMLVCLFFSVGFINAVNIVDGANGLVSGIFVVTCCIFAQEIDGYFLKAGLYTTSIFLLFNVVSGRLFLGDAGAYGLGSCMLMIGLVVFNENIASLTFLAALFFYPCFDFLVSLFRRRLDGRRITDPDNDHFHNRLHAFFQRRFRSKNMANSMTGVSISMCSSGMVLLLYLSDTIALNSHQWILIFIAQVFIYFTIYIYSGVRLRKYARLDEIKSIEDLANTP